PHSVSSTTGGRPSRGRRPAGSLWSWTSRIRSRGERIRARLPGPSRSFDRRSCGSPLRLTCGSAYPGLFDQICDLRRVSHPVILVAVVHEDVELLRLAGQLLGRLDPLRELVLRVEVAE